MAEGGFDLPAGTVVMETAVDMRGLEQDMKALEKRGEEIGDRAGAGFSEGFGEGTKKVEGAREALEGVSKSAEDAGGKVSEAKDSMSEMTDEADTAKKATGGLAAVLIGSLSRGATRALAKVTHLVELGVMALGSATADLGKKMQAASRDMKHFDDTTRVAGKTVETTGAAVHGLAEALHTLKLILTVGTIGTMVKAVDVANDFESSFNKIETAIPAAGRRMTVLRSKLSALSSETGIAAETINEAYFKVITRMPRLQQDAAKALELTRTAAEAESTGFTTAAQAVETYEAVLQGFNLEAENAERISSKLFKTQELAGVSFDKIAQNIGDVAATSDALGGEFEDLLAIYATLVPTGQSVSEVTTQMQGVIQGLIKPTGRYAEAAERMGIDMDAAAVRSKGLLTVIEDVIEATEGRPEVIAQLFGQREARTLLISLADRLRTLKKRHEQVSDAQGEHADTVRTMNEDVKKLAGRIKQDLLDSLRQFGFGLREGLGNPAIWTLKQIRKLTRGLAGFTDKSVQNLDRIDQAVEAAGGLMALMTVSGMGRFGAAMQRQRGFEGEEEEAGEPVPFPQGPSSTGRIQRPGVPLAGEFHRRAIEAERARRSLAAFEEFLETGDLEQYEAALGAVQLKINDMVEATVESMRALGASDEEIRKVTELYDEQAGRVEVATEQYDSLAERLQAVAEAMGALPDDSLLPPGFEDEGELREAAGDMESTVARLHGRLRQLQQSGASPEEIFTEMKAAMGEADVSMEDLQDSTLGLARIVARDLGAMFPIWAGWADGAEGADEETSKLAETMQDLSVMATGVLNIADAMGVLDDQTRQALQGVSSLAQSLGQTAEEGESGFLGTGLTMGGAVGAVGAGVSILSGLFGGGLSEQEKELQDLTEALRDLRSSVDAVRGVFDQIPGGKIGQFREFFEGLTTEPSELFSDFGPMANFAGLEGGEFLSRLREMGLEFSDLERLADSLDIEIDDLKQAFEGGAASTNQMIDEINALRQAARELELERLTEGFRGQLDLLRQEFELFDIEDSADQLQRMRELFLEFTDLPADLEAAIAGADLSTAEGRRQFEQALQEIFRMIQSGEISPGALGDLTLDQFREMLTELEGLTDDLGGEATGETTSFQRVNTIQEVTADQMLGTLTTISFINDQQLAVQRSILSALGGDRNLGDLPGSIRASRGAGAGGGGVSLTIEDLIVESPPMPDSISSPEEARRFGRQQGLGVADGLSERLAEHRLDFEQAQGRRRAPEIE